MGKLFLSVLLAPAIFAAGHAGELKFSNGAIRSSGGFIAGVNHHGNDWMVTSQIRDFKPAQTGNPEKISGVWKIDEARTADFHEEIRTIGKNTRHLNLKFSSKGEIGTKILAFTCEVPVHFIYGKPMRVENREFFLPETQTSKFLLGRVDNASYAEIPLEQGVLTIRTGIPCGIEVLDARVFKSDRMILRINFPKNPEKPLERTLSLVAEYRPYQITPIDISKSVNRSFTDETADDQKGGWTDQGPKNDLRGLPPGKLQVTPVVFHVLSASKNGGKSCMVLGGGESRPYFPKRIEVPVKKLRLRSLFLLHALAWTPLKGTEIGTVSAVFEDGTRYEIPVRSGIDCGNWWGPMDRSNARIAWSGANGESPVGLYYSRFELPDKPLKRLDFLSNGKAVWMIAGISGSPENAYPARAMAYRFMRNKDWRVIRNQRDIVKDSALDFSFINDAPAGKYGHLQVKNGKFMFEKQNKPIRFYGANLCFSTNFLSKKEADALAVRLSRIGYNSVRIHHFDYAVLDRRGPGLTTLDPVALDKLEYLIARLKENGLYITTDLFTYRYNDQAMKRHPFKSVTFTHPREYKLAAMIVPEVNQDFKTFIRNLLPHRNPYTGMTWAEDPVFIGLSILNENTINHCIKDTPSSPVNQIYNRKFEEWCAAKKLNLQPEEREEHWLRFLDNVYADYYRDMVAFLRKLGVRSPLTEQNMTCYPNTLPQRLAYDYVDNHTYYGHPRFLERPWMPPILIDTCSSVKLPQRNGVLHYNVPSRIFGKPFMMTEIDFCYPNPTRAEGAPLFGAFSAMQDLDGLYRFAYSHSRENLVNRDWIDIFDVVNDPARILSERLGIVFFTRGDVQPSSRKFVLATPLMKDVRERRYPEGARELAFFGQIGSAFYDGGTFQPALPKGTAAVYSYRDCVKPGDVKVPVLTGTPEEVSSKLIREKVLSAAETAGYPDSVTSSTGELVYRFKDGVFRAVTPRSEAVVLPKGESFASPFMSGKNREAFAVLGSIALDGKPLKESKRILILHLGDVQIEGTKYSSPEMNIILEHNIKGAPLVRRVVTDLELAAGQGDWKLYALELSGRRAAEIPFRVSNGKIAFTADNFQVKNKAILAYELTR